MHEPLHPVPAVLGLVTNLKQSSHLPITYMSLYVLCLFAKRQGVPQYSLLSWFCPFFNILVRHDKISRSLMNEDMPQNLMRGMDAVVIGESSPVTLTKTGKPHLQITTKARLMIEDQSLGKSTRSEDCDELLKQAANAIVSSL